MTDLAPPAASGVGYGVHVRVAWGFAALEGIGWQWRRTQRRDPERVARHWLVRATATLWTVAVGRRVEGGRARAICATRPWRPPRQPGAGGRSRH